MPIARAVDSGRYYRPAERLPLNRCESTRDRMTKRKVAISITISTENYLAWVDLASRTTQGNLSQAIDMTLTAVRRGGRIPGRKII